MLGICYKKILFLISIFVLIFSITGCIKITSSKDYLASQSHTKKMWDESRMYEVVNTISAYNSYFKDIKMTEYPQGANIICIGEEGEFYITIDHFYVPAKDLKISEN